MDFRVWNLRARHDAAWDKIRDLAGLERDISI